MDLMNRGRRSVAVDLKHPEGAALVLRLVEQADGLMEGFRPGVADRLGLGPDVCLGPEPEAGLRPDDRLGPDGPLSSLAGHDINYIALSGALEPMGRAGERPVPPLNLVGDFGGGGMLLAFGMVAAMLERPAHRAWPGHRRRHGRRGRLADGHDLHPDRPPASGRTSAAPTCWTAEPISTRCTRRPTAASWRSGAIEPQFYAELIRLMGLAGEELPDQMDRGAWPAMKERFAAVFATKTRDEWEAVFEGSDACAAPVLTPGEAPDHPHNRARQTFTNVAGVAQPAPAPRFERHSRLDPPPAAQSGPARRRRPGPGAGSRRSGTSVVGASAEESSGGSGERRGRGLTGTGSPRPTDRSFRG